ncbi:MAG: cytochrome c biogenesis protein CcdA, partial [Acidimicrobiia bacterium]
RELPSIFMFGISYAIVSISCTAPIFFGSVIGSFGRESFVDGLAVFIAYALGMSLVIMTLTLGIAMARTGIATNMRRFLPYVNRVSGGLLVIAGAFLAWYGWWEIQIARGSSESNALVDLSNDASARLQEWINDVGTGRFAMATVVIIVGAITWALTAGLTRRSDRLILRSGFVVVYLLIEAVRYDFDLLLLPLLRTIADIPERVSNWFTDPGRWPVLFEVALAAVLIAIAFFWTRHAVTRARGRDSATPTETREDTLNVSV